MFCTRALDAVLAGKAVGLFYIQLVGDLSKRGPTRSHLSAFYGSKPACLTERFREADIAASLGARGRAAGSVNVRLVSAETLPVHRSRLTAADSSNECGAPCEAWLSPRQTPSAPWRIAPWCRRLRAAQRGVPRKTPPPGKRLKLPNLSRADANGPMEPFVEDAR